MRDPKQQNDLAGRLFDALRASSPTNRWRQFLGALGRSPALHTIGRVPVLGRVLGIPPDTLRLSGDRIRNIERRLKELRKEPQQSTLAEIQALDRDLKDSWLVMKDEFRREMRATTVQGLLQALSASLMIHLILRYSLILKLEQLLVAHPQVFGPVAAVFIGFALYVLRTKVRRTYGSLEVLTGVVTVHYAATEFRAIDEKFTLLLASALYVIVRGIDNFVQGQSAARRAAEDALRQGQSEQDPGN